MAKFELDRTFLQMVHFYIGNVPEVEISGPKLEIPTFLQMVHFYIGKS